VAATLIPLYPTGLLLVAVHFLLLSDAASTSLIPRQAAPLWMQNSVLLVLVRWLNHSWPYATPYKAVYQEGSNKTGL